MGRGLAIGIKLSACADRDVGSCGTGGDASWEKRRPVGDRGGGGVGARSWTERLDEVTDAALAERRRREVEFFLMRMLRSIVDVLDSEGKMRVLLTTALAPESLSPALPCLRGTAPIGLVVSSTRSEVARFTGEWAS